MLTRSLCSCYAIGRTQITLLRVSMQSVILLWQIRPSVCLSHSAIVSKQMYLCCRLLEAIVYSQHLPFPVRKQYTEPSETCLRSWTFTWNSTNSRVWRLGQIPWYWKWHCNFRLHQSLWFSSPSTVTAQTELLWHTWHCPSVDFQPFYSIEIKELLWMDPTHLGHKLSLESLGEQS